MANLRAFAMPKWGIEMTEGVVAEWKVAQGQPFRKGDLLALIETAKITNEVEAEADGQFARLIAKEGETYDGLPMNIAGSPQRKLQHSSRYCFTGVAVD